MAPLHQHLQMVIFVNYD